jgi:DNA-binding NarL/FixJ family response regulator
MIFVKDLGVHSAPIYAATHPVSIVAAHHIRLIIVDDQPAYRRILCAALKNEPDIEIVGEAEEGGQAVEMAQNLAPDVVLMDINMAGMDGIQATRSIVTHNPRIGVIILTAYHDAEHILKAIQAGAAAHLGKEIHPGLLPTMIRAVYHGEALIDSQVTSLLLTEFRSLSQLK